MSTHNLEARLKVLEEAVKGPMISSVLDLIIFAESGEAECILSPEMIGLYEKAIEGIEETA